MSNIILENSKVAYEPLRACLCIRFQHVAIMQTPSVIPTGHLWQSMLDSTIKDSPLEISGYEVKETSVSHITEQEQKNFALAQLLRSRREGDEREQRDTWKRLKRALDEDRLSDRKLFP